MDGSSGVGVDDDIGDAVAVEVADREWGAWEWDAALLKSAVALTEKDVACPEEIELVIVVEVRSKNQRR
jgi:hypothetical protein